MSCMSGEKLYGRSLFHWGHWQSTARCRSGYAISGIQTRYFGDSGILDDTGLTGLKMFCRKYPIDRFNGKSPKIPEI